jgi:hypothetical protein
MYLYRAVDEVDQTADFSSMRHRTERCRESQEDIREDSSRRVRRACMRRIPFTSAPHTGPPTIGIYPSESQPCRATLFRFRDRRFCFDGYLLERADPSPGFTTNSSRY